MFCYQRDFNSEIEVINSVDRFEEIINDPAVHDTLVRCRQCKNNGDGKGLSDAKKSLPMFIFTAARFVMTFRDSKRKKNEGFWRRQNAAYLNGLAVLDLDHLKEKPETVWKRISEKIFSIPLDAMAPKWKILAAFITPSTEGLKIVFTADPEVGNIADNQIAFSQYLGIENDESIKDSCRGHFVVSIDYFLFLNEEKLINYENESFEEKYGKLYRSGKSAPLYHKDNNIRGRGDHHDHSADGNDTAVSGCSGTDGLADTSYKDLKYGSTSVEDIATGYQQRYGRPVEGDRHRSCIKLAGHFRYLVDNNAQKLKVALRAVPWVREWEHEEGNTREIDDIATSVCDMRMWREIPKALTSVIQGVSGGTHEGCPEVEGNASASLAKGHSREIWDRLQPLLADDPLYTVCTAHLGADNKIAGVFVAGAMFDTLATRVYYRHYDGKLHRMNPNVMVIGAPASGKSFANDMDDAIMAVLIAADEPGRRAEAEYKKEQKKRRTSNKASKGEQQLKEPEEVIRYIPSRTSNAIFYRRQRNAKELVNGELMPLHLYTFDSELDSTVTAQSGGAWITKHDIELKAFHNEKSGVDYANDDSVNELIPIYWNQIVTGTDVSLARKINMRNVNDGLCSRIAFVRIASEEFKMLQYDSDAVLAKNFDTMKRWGEFFDSLKGEIAIPKLVQHCYNLCEKAAKAAEVTQDRVLDYMRKRAVFYAEWFTIPRILARAKIEADKNKDGSVNIMRPTVTQSDLDFAELIFDTIIYYQDLFFGQMLEECWQNGANSFVVRRQIRTSFNEELLKQLPTEFTAKDARDLLKSSSNAVNMQLKRWSERGLIKKIMKSKWKKIA